MVVTNLAVLSGSLALGITCVGGMFAMMIPLLIIICGIAAIFCSNVLLNLTSAHCNIVKIHCLDLRTQWYSYQRNN